MPRATLKAKSNDGLVALSEAHPDAVFEVLGAWPDGEEFRLLGGVLALGATVGLPFVRRSDWKKELKEIRIERRGDRVLWTEIRDRTSGDVGTIEPTSTGERRHSA